MMSFVNLAQSNNLAREYDKMYFCTTADERYFPLLINLIGSIHKVNFDELGEIAVFDLGFTEQQLDELHCIEKVRVYNVELTHPDLLKPNSRLKRGWYAWKPVVKT